MAAGDPVEVYSESLRQWIAGALPRSCVSAHDSQSPRIDTGALCDVGAGSIVGTVERATLGPTGTVEVSYVHSGRPWTKEVAKQNRHLLRMPTGCVSLRVRVEIMGPFMIGTGRDSPTFLHFCDPVISTRTRTV
jgi:hypothetical protein